MTLSYRELNLKANAIARHLIDNGFKRGMVATVCLPRRAETVVVLLGILKAGGTYAFVDREANDAQWPSGVSFAEKVDGDEVRFRTVDVSPALHAIPQSAANLPIVARASDVACVIPDEEGTPALLVPHATLMALQSRPVPRFAEWSGEAGALELWAALVNGATVTLTGARLRPAA